MQTNSSSLKRHRLQRLAIAATLAATCACAINPVTGNRQFSLLSQDQEIQLGAEADVSIVGQYGLSPNAELSGYVASVGQRMAKVSHRPDLQFHFRLLDDPVVNAFALPGGYVYMTRGIMAYINSEAAMAGIIGHEIGHITARHGADRYTKQAMMGLGLGVGSIVSEEVAALSGIAGAGAQLLLLKFGRDDETQSDTLGVEYASKVGYDTNDMGNFFNTLASLSGGGGRLPEWQSTHPDPGQRHVRVKQLTAEFHAANPGDQYELGRAEFLRKIDGMVYGPNPKAGYVTDGLFIHPGLNFQFPVPSGWGLNNSATQVQMGPQEGPNAGKMGVIFTLDGSTSVDEAAGKLVQQGLQSQAQDKITINGMPALRMVAITPPSQDPNQQQPQTGIVATFIQKDGKVFTFLGISPAAELQANLPSLTPPADGFKAVQNPAHLAVEPVTIKVIEAPTDTAFVEAVKAYPVPSAAQMDTNGLALLNGMKPATPVKKGELIKVLVQARSKAAVAAPPPAPAPGEQPKPEAKPDEKAPPTRPSGGFGTTGATRNTGAPKIGKGD